MEKKEKVGMGEGEQVLLLLISPLFYRHYFE